ncbi:MAG: hypothetical protein IT180_00395 [Acidobacteria bacterium]|nr:hypothetical protein [Acidobacteriota bacterium]
MKAGCTIVAKNCLSYARVLARSFRQHHPDVPFFVLLADQVQERFDPAAEPFTLVPLAALDLPRLERIRFYHPQQAFSYACTPALLRWLLGQGIDRVIYFKQETLILDEVSPIFDRLAESPVVLTPHLVAPLGGAAAAEREINILQSGVFNVGVLGVAAHPTSHRWLSWWQDRLSTECRRDVEAGLHFEQRWLDLAPGFFDGIHVLRDAAFNVGHWSLPERQIGLDPDGRVRVDGRPCRVFRFSGYNPDEPDQLTGYNQRLPWDALGAVRLVVDQFREALEREGYRETRTWPYAFGVFDNGVSIPDLARRLYLDLGEEADRFGDPFRTAPPQSYWHWLHALVPRTGLTRFWHAIYETRADLQQAYPDLDGPGSAAFMQWARQYGLAEHEVPAQMLPSGTP